MKPAEPFQKLIFVYNADTGLGNLIVDVAHKIISPDTYNCSLCAITYGAFSENSTWKKFRKETAIEMVFLHKDEFAKAYASKFGHKFTFPIVLTEKNDGLEVFVKTEELDELENAEALIRLISERFL